MSLLNTTKISVATVLSLSIMGCGGVSSVRPTVPSISEEVAFESLNKQKDTAALRAIEVDNAFKDYEANLRVNWIQAQNKKEDCKLFFGGDTWPESMDVYWDGECKDGYASGLGREFIKYINQDSVVDREEVALYKGGAVNPTYLAGYDRVKREYHLKAYDADGQAGIHQIFQEGTQGAEISTIVYSDLRVRKTGYDYLVRSSSLNSEFNVRVRGVGSDEGTVTYTNWGSLYNHLVLFETSDTIFGIGKLPDGRVLHKNLKENSNVNLPMSYLKAIQQIDGEIDEAINELMPKVKKSQEMVDYYLAEICQKEVNVDFMSNKKYKEICGKNGYFTSVIPEIEASTEKHLAQRKAQYDQWLAQQELQNQALYRQQMATAARRQAEAIESSNTANTLNNFNLQGINNGLQQLNNRMMMNNLFRNTPNAVLY